MALSGTNTTPAKSASEHCQDAQDALVDAFEAFNEVDMPQAREAIRRTAQGIFAGQFTATQATPVQNMTEETREKRKVEGEEALVAAYKSFQEAGDDGAADAIDDVGRAIMGDDAWGLALQPGQ